MRQGFVKVAAVTPKIRVADTRYNAKVICLAIKEAAEAGAKVIVLPELCITGYTCGDLFLQEKLLREAKEELLHIAEFTTDVDAIVFVGLPLAYKGKLYNVAAALNRGKFLVSYRKPTFRIIMNFMKRAILREVWKKWPMYG